MMTIFMKKFLQPVVQLFGNHSTAAHRALIRELIVPDEGYNPEQSLANDSG